MHKAQKTVTEVSNISELAGLIAEAAQGIARFALAVAGPPGSGKSTLADQLSAQIERPSCVIPMDGFHLDNRTLETRGLLARKGAPETFDLRGFSELIDRLLDGRTVLYPTFDRVSDAVVPDGGSVPPGTEILIFEGNYLLFDETDWAELNRRWDASVWIEVPEDVLQERLVQRWRDHGLSEQAAQDRASQNDMRNAQRIKSAVLPSTWVVAASG